MSGSVANVDVEGAMLHSHPSHLLFPSLSWESNQFPSSLSSMPAMLLITAKTQTLSIFQGLKFQTNNRMHLYNFLRGGIAKVKRRVKGKLSLFLGKLSQTKCKRKRGCSKCV